MGNFHLGQIAFLVGVKHWWLVRKKDEKRMFASGVGLPACLLVPDEVLKAG